MVRVDNLPRIYDSQECQITACKNKWILHPRQWKMAAEALLDHVGGAICHIKPIKKTDQYALIEKRRLRTQRGALSDCFTWTPGTSS
jgi:hypothetical protein